MCHFVETALRPLVLGQDPLDTERLWDAMYFGTHKLGTGGVQPSCIAGVDIALWDIKGKLLGQPLYRLLGGAVRTTFTMYKSIGGGGAMTPDAMLELVREAWDQGFKAFKIRMDWHYRQDVDPEKDLAMYRLCRDFLPSEIPLSFDANNGYSVGGAMRVGRVLEELGYWWFEEPVQHYHVRATGEVARKLSITVSAGEQSYTPAAVADLILAGVRMVQPDIVKMGGITGMQRCAALAQAHGAEFVPHQTQPTIGHLANLHLAATILHATKPCELNDPSPRMHAVFANPPRPVDGLFHLPAAPGLGLVIDEAALAKRRVDLPE